MIGCIRAFLGIVFGEQARNGTAVNAGDLQAVQPLGIYQQMHADLLEEMSLAVEKNDMHLAAIARGKIAMIREMVDVAKYIGIVNREYEKNGRRTNSSPAR